MRRLCCCGRAIVKPTPDLVADLPLCTRDSSPATNANDDNEGKGDQSPEDLKKKTEGDLFIVDGISQAEIPNDEKEESQPLHTPSIHIEDYSDKSLPTSLIDFDPEKKLAKSPDKVDVELQGSSNIEPDKSDLRSEKSTVSSIAADKSVSSIPSNKSATSIALDKTRSHTPESTRNGSVSPQVTEDVIVRHVEERDVRTALAECMVPARHEDWEVIVNGLVETERLAADEGARAPAGTWRAVTRSTATHVRSLRSKVARAACSTLGTLFEHRGRALDTELEEAAAALLDRCADVNRFLRADATSALGRVACGGGCARAGVALARRGAAHRGGPVRAAAAQALARLVRHNGASRVLELPDEPRTVILRAAGELLGDANAETRMHARHLCLALGEDSRFRHLLKDSMPPSRYRAIEKFVDKLRCR